MQPHPPRGNHPDQGTAHLRRHVGRSVGQVDTDEQIRRLADLCDGLAGPEAGASDRLRYRLSVLSADQAAWVKETLEVAGFAYGIRRPT